MRENFKNLHKHCLRTCLLFHVQTKKYVFELGTESFLSFPAVEIKFYDITLILEIVHLKPQQSNTFHLYGQGTDFYIYWNFIKIILRLYYLSYIINKFGEFTEVGIYCQDAIDFFKIIQEHIFCFLEAVKSLHNQFLAHNRPPSSPVIKVFDKSICNSSFA